MECGTAANTQHSTRARSPQLSCSNSCAERLTMRPTTMQVQPDQDDQDQLHRDDEHAGPGEAHEGPLPADLHQRSVRGPLGPSAGALPSIMPNTLSPFIGRDAAGPR